MQPSSYTPSSTPEPVVPSGTLPSPPSATPELPSKSPRGRLLLIVSVLVFDFLLIAAGLSYWYIASTNKPPTTTVKVGVMMAFSGGSSSMGYGAMKGIQLAKKQFNATTIELIQEDSKCDPKVAAEAVKRLIEQQVVAIIGEGCSSASVAALPAVNNARIPMISPSASSPTLSIPNDYFFRVVPPDNFQGAFMAQSIYDRGIRNVAVFYTNEPYGSGMNTVFREKFEELGGKVVATASDEPDVIDLDTQIKELKAAKPEAVFIAPNSVVTATAVVKLAREAQLNVPLFGADIMYDSTIISNAQAAADGLTISSFPTGTKSFKQALVNEYQKTEQLYAAPQAYDIMQALQLALQNGAKSGEDIKNALSSISFQGVSGNIQFDQNGEISDKDYRYDLFQVKDGQFVLTTE